MKIRLILSSIILLIIALGFNVFFTLTSLDKLYIESIVSQYRVIGKDLQQGIERGLRYGKNIQSFVGIDNLLAEAKTIISEQIINRNKTSDASVMNFLEKDISIYVAAPDGKIFYGDIYNKLSNILPEPVMANYNDNNQNKKRSSSSLYYKYNNNYFTCLPLRNSHNNIVGYVFITLKDNQIKLFIDDIFRKNKLSIGILASFGILTLLILLYFFAPTNIEKDNFSKKWVLLIIFTVISSAQIISCGLSTFAFHKFFLHVNKENTLIVNAMLTRDMGFILNHGIRIDRLKGFDSYMGDIITNSPEINDITLFDHTNQPLYRATKTSMTDFQTSDNCYQEWLEATKPISNYEYNARKDLIGQGESKGYFSTNVSKDLLFDKLSNIVIDSITVIVISLLFFVELLILIFKYVERGGEITNFQSPPIHYGLMRPAAFLLLFGIDISVSFLPLHMEILYAPLLGLTKDTVMGLPIAIEFLFVGLSILISGIWLDRRGWHEPFVSGLFIAISGVLYSWLAPNAVHFIISRGIVGLGYGLSLMASQGFVITHSDWKNKAQALAQLFAGIYAGSICGAATGGMLADWMGYRPVFLFGVFILALVIIYTIIFMRHSMIKPVSHVSYKTPTKKGSHVFKFFFNRTILGLIFFSSLPSSIAVIGFLNYFSPIYLNRIGTSQSAIGQILMLYGICLIYFGPFLSRYVDASRNKKAYIFLGCVLGSLSLLTFYVLEGIRASIIAVLLLGISSSFVLASQSAYALKLKVTQQLGEGKAIGIFRATSRVGQMLGPFVFSSIIIATNTNTGITYLGVAYLLTAFLFLIFTQKDFKTVLIEEV